MKIKIIDLLNRIAVNEVIPYRIYYNENIYEYDGETQNYYKLLNFTKDWLIGEDITALLNDEVEIIEEPKKIKKCKNYDDFLEINEYIEHLKNKINELIDEINNLKEN
jgi:hypothetical protein